MKLHFYCPLFILLLSSLVLADEISLNFTPVQRIVDYEYSFPEGNLLPGIKYEGAITAKWAVPNSSLFGLEGKTIAVKVSAFASNDSEILFTLPFGGQSKSTETYLRCIVQNASCANGSVLHSKLPFTIVLKEMENISANIRLKSEIVPSEQILHSQLPVPEKDISQSASEILESLKTAFGPQNSSQKNESNLHANQSSKDEEISRGNQNKDLLSELKPEGNPKNPLEFLQANPLVSIAAFAIVAIIIGAYLLNSKD
ncbi:MAG: hypothetical protein QW275_00030 [Candidatus Anstonellaceae archaeon]